MMVEVSRRGTDSKDPDVKISCLNIGPKETPLCTDGHLLFLPEEFL